MNLTENNFNKVSFELNEEFKEIIYKEIIETQNCSTYNLSNHTEYSMFHDRLDTFFKKHNFKNKPNKTDYLAWILLLTYPIKYIRKLQNISNLNINFKNEESDFEILELTSETKTEDDINTNYTCICSQIIQNIYKVKNKFTDIKIQIGCDCIERHKLVSKTEIDNCKQKMKDIKERNKEKTEGKPDGFYKEQRKNAIEIKNKQKEMKQEEKLMKQEDDIVKTTIQSYHYKNCLICKKEGLYNKYSIFIICNKCVNQETKNKIRLINTLILKNKREYIYDECCNCENKFIYMFKNNLRYFCDNCEKNKKIKNCDLCYELFMDNINSTDKICDICDKKSKECTNCKHLFISDNKNILICDTCQYRLTYNLIAINCQDCNEEVEIKKNENWRKYCVDCFKNNLKYINCISCSLPFKRLLNETWRTKCRDCYSTNRK